MDDVLTPDRLSGPAVPHYKTGATKPVRLDVTGKTKRQMLIKKLRNVRQMKDEWIKRQVMEYGRTDVLAGVILGYEVIPKVHGRICEFQNEHDEGMILIFRGAGKSTTGTIVRSIYEIIQNRNVRVLIASKTADNAKSFLKEIKYHLQNNDDLIRIFGRFYDEDAHRGGKQKWDESAINVMGRTISAKENTITTIGVEGAIASKHYDVIICDDLVDEKNSMTKGQRDKVRVFYYKMIDPCLEPGGKRWVIGTRYHPDDLYGHLKENEFSKAMLHVKALDSAGESPWPAKFPAKWFEKKKRRVGSAIFDAQYQNEIDRMVGEIFSWDTFEQYKARPPLKGLRVFQAYDLAIGTREMNDYFAWCTIGIDKDMHIWVLQCAQKRMSFFKQLNFAARNARKWGVVRAGVESVAYQAAFISAIKEMEGTEDIRAKFVKVPQTKDKVQRAWGIQALFEDSRVHIHKNNIALMEQLVDFPNAEHDDMFDALEMAISLGLKKVRVRRRRDSEPGLL